ncbi:hypothetical protein SLS58_004431 [Diplodia intermedia]|uniref:Uncharacterized protein n=1 Tax=Diplodia intermedia TaxID=856260 RepID=A0ABR3TTU8_9PEZI
MVLLEEAGSGVEPAGSAASPPPPPPPIPKDLGAGEYFGAVKGKGKEMEGPVAEQRAKDGGEEGERAVEDGEGRQGGEVEKAVENEAEATRLSEEVDKHIHGSEGEQPVKSKDEGTAVDAVDFGADSGRADRATADAETQSAAASGVALSQPTTEAAVPRQSQEGAVDSSSRKEGREMNISRPISRQISAVNSPAGSRPVSSVGSTSAAAQAPAQAQQFVAPEEWETLPDPASPVSRAFSQSPISRSGTPGGHRSFAERAQSPIQRSATPGTIAMPTAQYASGSAVGRSGSQKSGKSKWERLGVLPSPSIEPLSWLDEKEKRRSLAAEARMERVIESVVRNSTPVSVRSKGSAGSMGRFVTGGDEDLQADNVEEGVRGEEEGAKSSRQSFAQRATAGGATSSRQSIRTRDSKGSIASLLPIPLDEMAKKGLTLEDHELDRPKFDVSPIELDDAEADARDEQLRAATNQEQPEQAEEHEQAHDAHAEVQRSPSPESHGHGIAAEVVQSPDPIEQPPRLASPLQDISTAAAAPADVPVSTEQDGGSREYQVSPVNAEFDAGPSPRPIRRDMEQAPRPFSYMEGQGAQEEVLQLGNMGPRYGQRAPPQGPNVPSNSGSQRRLEGHRRSLLLQSDANDNFTRPDFDPRLYSSEFTLPGVGPPDHSETSELRAKRRSILGTIGSGANSRASPSGSNSNTPPSKSVERVNERINPQHIDQGAMLHRSFSYQSSVHEGQLKPTTSEEASKKSKDADSHKQKRQRSGIFSPFKRNDASTSQSQLAKAPPPLEAEQASPVVAPNQSKKGRKVLQRNASSGRLSTEPMSPAAEKEKKDKKKRSSLFGSIFGRSSSAAATEREKDEKKKLRSSDSKGKLSKLRKVNTNSSSGNLSAVQQPQGGSTEVREAAYAPVPQPPRMMGSYRELREGAGVTEEALREQGSQGGSLKSTGEQRIPPPPPSAGSAGGSSFYSTGTLPASQHAGYPGPAAVASSGFAPRPGPAPRTRYYSQPSAPQRALSQDRALWPNGPPPPSSMPPPGRRFSEQMLQQYPPAGPARAYQTPPPPQQYGRHPSQSSEYGAALSPQVSALTPTQPGEQPPPQQRQGSGIIGRAGEEMIVSPIMSRASESSGGGNYFGRVSPDAQRKRGPSDAFERQRLWHMQQQQQQQQQSQSPAQAERQRSAGRIPQQRGPYQQQPPPPLPPSQQQQWPHPNHIPHQQQQRPFELSLPGNTANNESSDSGEDDRRGGGGGGEFDQSQSGVAWSPPSPPMAAGGPAAAMAAAYREVLPRGYTPVTTTATAAAAIAAISGAGGNSLSPTTTTTTAATRIEPRWKEISPEEAETELERVRERQAQERLLAQERERERQRETELELELEQRQQRNVHPMFRHSPKPSLSGGGRISPARPPPPPAKSSMPPITGNISPRPPPGLEGGGGQNRPAVHPTQRYSAGPVAAAGDLQMDPAYAKEYGISASSSSPGRSRHHHAPPQQGGKIPGGDDDDSEDDEDDEDLYAEPTGFNLRSRESGQQGAQVLERAQREAGSAPSPPSMMMSTVPPAQQQQQGKEDERREGAEERQREGRGEGEDADEPVVMQAASYPGMEWTPRWDGTVE